MVLLKKDSPVLPLNKSSGKILVSGTNADNIGNQCGGWTISWQGSSGNITPGTTILTALQNAVDGATVVFSADGSGVSDADVGVIVIGELPYAEFSGDRDDLALTATDVETVKRVKQAGIPTVVILISGRPMILDEILPYTDVLFAAWLPGTEGDGVADILFGDYQPTGMLTHSWPGSMDQIPVNWDDEVYDPLFPYKHTVDGLADNNPATIPGFYLNQNFPNPFNARTSISYFIPKPAKIVLKIFNLLGSELRTLVQQNQTTGFHSISFDATEFSSGVYFYRLQVDDRLTETKKMIVLR
jgi:hypothetical protein